MFLLRLKEYADRIAANEGLPPPLYSETPIRYIIELDSHGRLLSREPVDTADPGNPKTKRGQRRLAPQVQRAVGIKPLLLADNAEYTLGLARETSRPDRVAACHQAYLDLLDRCAAGTQAPAVAAVRAFLHADPATQLALPADYDRGATITFRVDGRFVVDLPAVQSFWAAENDPAARSAPTMQCLICGQERPVLERLQGKIKGIPGGQTSGTSIISANADAFESYGLRASLIAPTCADCGEKFTKALNGLLADRTHRYILGDAVAVYWTRDDTAFDLFSFIDTPTPEAVRNLYNAVYTGQATSLDDTAFYAATLSASGGRAVVRDWIDTSLRTVQARLAAWFQRQAIVDAYGEAPEPLGVRALAGATVRELSDVTPPTMRALLRAALVGTPLPLDLLYQAVRRNHAEQAVTRPRAALIKLVLLSQQPDTQENTMVQLTPDHPSAAYHCGRLLAVLEQAQRQAIPGIKASIVDRFFGSASTAPASVFPRLIRGAQPHLAKLERDNEGAYHALQGRLEDILARVREFPTTLTLTQQGLFALGYYHQRAFDRAQARASAERRKAGTGSDEGRTTHDQPAPDA